MSRARPLVGPAVAGLAVALYTAAFRRYGIFDPVDEGLLLVQAWRTAHGQAPFVDFHTGYGPLYFRVQALLLAAGGLASVRWALVAVHATAAALLYALARRLAGSALAAVAVALEVAFFLPVAPARGAPFNLPYPAWYAGLGGIAVALLLAGEVPAAPVRVALAGLLCGLVAALKPNSGLLLGAGAVAALVIGDGRRGPAGWAGRVALAVVAALAVALVAPTAATLDAWVLAPPVLALAALGVIRGAPDRESVPRVLILATGFLLAAAVSFGPLFLALGAHRFGREVLFLGTGIAGLLVLPFPWPAGVAALVGLALFVGRGRPARLAIGGVVGTAAVAIAAAAVRTGGPLPALRLGAEEAALAAVPLVAWGGLVALRQAGGVPLAAATAVSVLGVLQLYPRPDFAHLMPLGVLLLPLGVRLWRDAAAGLALPGALTPVVAIVLPLAAAAGRFAPTAIVLVRIASGRLEQVELGAARLEIEPAGTPALHALGDTAAAVRALSPEERVLTFPACGLIPFLAERSPAGPHDYFFPGRPDRAEVAALTARLALAPPRLAVTCTADDTPLAAAWTYYAELVRFLALRYRPREAHPPYVVLEASSSSRLAAAWHVTCGPEGVRRQSMKDPVCGREVEPSTAAAETQYEGGTYRFCSEDCYQEFMLDPEEYVEPQPEA